MASKRTRANKPEMIHCPYCGEDYSSTYKHCPFCDEVEPAEDDYQTDEYDEAPPLQGRQAPGDQYPGRRLRRGHFTAEDHRHGGLPGPDRGGGHHRHHHHPAPGSQGRRGRPGGQHHAGGKRDPHPGRQPVGDRARR